MYLGYLSRNDDYWMVLVATDHLRPFFSGSSRGSIAQYAIERQTGFMNHRFFKSQVNVISSDARGRTSIPDCSVSCPIS